MTKKYTPTLLSLLLSLLLPVTLLAQSGTVGNAQRLVPNAALAPFFHGVASGDPMSDRVIIWTRVTTADPTAMVEWRIATDTAMQNVLQTGTVMTDTSRDYTVHIDVTGLQPNHYYYYEFGYNGSLSVRGRTKTLPVGNVDSLRFGVVACSAMGYGYFNAYSRLTARNDVDAILHLGDYIYEYGDGQFGSVRNMTPTNEALNLNDYRMRHGDYKLDADLMRLHQQYPFITVWDDHETANDSWKGGAANHTPATEGDWLTRKAAGTRAYLEWMPIRQPDPTNAPQRIYRKFSFGDLMDLIMVDTRLEGREEQVAAGQATNTSATRTLMGAQQFDWTCRQLRQSTAQWKVMGNQVMMAPLKLFGQVLNQDQWDGYPAERSKLFDTLNLNTVQNLVVLTGDIHTSWGHDLPLPNYQTATGAGSVGVEYVVTSVTSQGSPLSLPTQLIKSSNPHCKYFELTKKGYLILDVNKQRSQGEWWYVDKVDAPSSNEAFAQAWKCDNNTRHLVQAAAPAVAHPSKVVTQAPLPPRNLNTQTTKTEDFVFLGLYPNPATQKQLTLQYYNRTLQNISLQVTDITGKVVLNKDLGQQGVGLIYENLYLPTLSAGVYTVSIVSKEEQVSKKVVISD